MTSRFDARSGSAQGNMSVSKIAPPSGLPADVTVISLHPMYSAVQVATATVLGGPFGGAWLIALNYKRLDAPRKARTALALGRFYSFRFAPGRGLG